MSDGPHRSLPMPRHWKDLAKRAAKAAFSSDEVCEALPVALKRDFLGQRQALDEIKGILGCGPQSSLFANDRLDHLEEARSQNPGSTALGIMLDCAIEAVQSGLTGDSAFQSAMTSALSSYTRGEFRAIEEHYQRKDSTRSARFVRQRLEAALGKCDLGTVASDIAAAHSPKVSEFQLQKYTGVDEGPPL